MVWSFFIENIPPWQLIIWLAPISFVYAVASLFLSGWLKQNRNWKTGYSRKLFHFAIFGIAGVVQVFWGYPGIIVFGSSVSLVIFYAVYQGDGYVLYEAMAREKDAPRRSHYILMPYVATLLGGLLNNFMFNPEIAVFGYLVAGLGDAIAEPIGTKFGKHTYAVPSLVGVSSKRSLEGSLAVLIGSFLALILAGMLSSLILSGTVIAIMAIIAVAAMLVEAISPHGWDNLTLQVITGLACYFLLF